MRPLVAIAVLLAAPSAAAAVRKDFPYPGSVYESIESKPAPLLVVLHGDNQLAVAMRDVWSAPSAKRGVAVLYLQCPKTLGCTSSFWQWNGDPKFIDDAVDKVADDIDPDRVWLAGWSGGSSYLGLRAFELSDKYAALSINGGGLQPERAECPERVLPTYFLVGDKNPLHHYMKDLRAALDRCKGELQWDVRAGADHNAEWKALKKDADVVLAWLEKHPRPKKVVAVAAPTVDDAGIDAAAPSPPAPIETTPPPRPPPARSCACETNARQTASSSPLLLLVAAIFARRVGTRTSVAARRVPRARDPRAVLPARVDAVDHRHRRSHPLRRLPR